MSNNVGLFDNVDRVRDREDIIGKIKMKRPLVTKFGNNSKNNYAARTSKGEVFVSYDTVIAFIDRSTGITYLDEHYWDYSHTTGYYRNQFLGEGIVETREKIESGEYMTAELNK